MANDNLTALRLADGWASLNLVCAYPRGHAASAALKKFLQYLDDDAF